MGYFTYKKENSIQKLIKELNTIQCEIDNGINNKTNGLLITLKNFTELLVKRDKLLNSLFEVVETFTCSDCKLVKKI